MGDSVQEDLVKYEVDARVEASEGSTGSRAEFETLAEDNSTDEDEDE